MEISLPSRYEDLDSGFRGSLRPNQTLNKIIQDACKAMKIAGGLRFLPIFGESGAGKSCASREIETHLPDTFVYILNREEIEDAERLKQRIAYERKTHPGKIPVAVIDQFEEQVSGKESIPSQFIETISVLDRNKDFSSLIFIWLTTDKQFQSSLVKATSRNKRILIEPSFEILGPEKREWIEILKETFTHHNNGSILSDCGIVDGDLNLIAQQKETIGEALQELGARLGESISSIQNLSEYQVIMVWPVADETRLQKVLQFTNPREGYLLNWDAWYRELSEIDKRQLPIKEYNRTRLYFDFRLIPLRAADLHKLCLDLDSDPATFAATYLDKFKETHVFKILSDEWSKENFSAMRTRESQRSADAQAWYSTVTNQPTKIGRRIAHVLSHIGLNAVYEKSIESKHASLRADIFIEASATGKTKKIVELKVYSTESTMPSSIREQIKVTMKRHANFGGFLPRQ